MKQDETILDIATDKVDSEVPSTSEGIISEILFNINDVVPIGTVIARIRTEAYITEIIQPVTEPVVPEQEPEPVIETVSETQMTPVVKNKQTSGFIYCDMRLGYSTTICI